MDSPTTTQNDNTLSVPKPMTKIQKRKENLKENLKKQLSEESQILMDHNQQQLDESLFQDNSEKLATWFDGEETLDRILQKLYDSVGDNLSKDVEDDMIPFTEVNNILIQCGVGDDTDYSDGVFKAIVDKKQQVTDICDILDDLDYIEGYEILILEKSVGGSIETDDIEFDMIDDSYGGFKFMILIYLKIENVVYLDYYDQDEDDEEFDEESSMLMEVRRRIKIDFKGKKRIKMQCKPGYKWTGNACMKITGSELATKRKAKRRELITKKSKGSSFKIRMLRKTKKANKFRKAMGLS